MVDVTRKDRAKRMAVGAAVSVTVLATTAGPLAAQQVVELPADDRLLGADFEEIYRLGSMDGGGWESFGHLAGVAFDGAGNLYILDTGAVRIYVVGPGGNLVRQFIGEGEGPGEFGGDYASSLEFAIMSDGRVAVYDTGHMRFAVFAADGEFERAIPMKGPHTHFPLLGGLQAFPGTARVLATYEVGYLNRGEPGPDEDAPVPFRHVLSYDLSGDQVHIDSVAAGWGPPVERDAAFRPTLVAGVLPSGAVVYSDSSAYAIKVAEPGGRVTLVLTRPFRPAPVTGRVRAAEIERRLEGLGDVAGDPLREAMNEWRRRQIEEMEFFPEIPVVLGLATGPEGTIWVHHRGDRGTEGNPIDLISQDGRYLGTFAPGSVSIPSAFGPNGLAAFVERGDLDVSYVVVKRLPEGMR